VRNLVRKRLVEDFLKESLQELPSPRKDSLSTRVISSPSPCTIPLVLEKTKVPSPTVYQPWRVTQPQITWIWINGYSGGIVEVAYASN